MMSLGLIMAFFLMITLVCRGAYEIEQEALKLNNKEQTRQLENDRRLYSLTLLGPAYAVGSIPEPPAEIAEVPKVPKAKVRVRGINALPFPIIPDLPFNI